jgi:hypothetical protein
MMKVLLIQPVFGRITVEQLRRLVKDINTLVATMSALKDITSGEFSTETKCILPPSSLPLLVRFGPLTLGTEKDSPFK